MLHDRQVVGDEQVGQAEPVLQVEQQVDDLRLDRDVERRDRLVGDDQRRVERERAGDADALPLAAGEGVREAVHVGRRQLHQVEQLAHPARAAPRGRACRSRSSGSAMMSVIVMRGLSEENGSWKIICIWRRSGRSSGLRQARRRRPGGPPRCGSGSRPTVGVMRAQDAARGRGLAAAASRRPARAVSPRRIVKLTSSTARTWPTTRRSRPRRIGNHLRRLSTSRMVSGRRAHPAGSSSVGTGAVAADHAARRESSSPRAAAPSAIGGRQRRARRRPAIASGQRGWKGQPVRPRVGMRDRALDGRAGASAASPARSGSSAAASACRGACGSWKIASTGPRSTSRPRYITTTSSAISAITPMSWVIRITARPRSCLQLADQVEDLRLRRDVERGRRLVGDQDARLGGERQRDHHALAQAARELEGVAVDALRRGAGCRPGAAARRRARAPRAWTASACRRIASISWLPIVWKAESELIGSWKT